MTSAGQDDLARIAGLVVYENDRIWVKPATGQVLPVQLRPDPPAPAWIAAWLYANHYADCPGLFEDHRNTEPLRASGIRAHDPTFYERLQTAYRGTGYVDKGWLVVGHEGDDTVLVQKDGVTLYASRGEIVPDLSTREMSGHAGVRFPKDALLAAPGFYVCFSNAGPVSGQRIVRIYITARVKFAQDVLKLLAHALSSTGLRATIKMCADRHRFIRRDNTVVYIHYDSYVSVLAALKSAFGRQPHLLRPISPAFAMPVGPGIAVAQESEEISQGRFALDSFGMSRCRLVAAALLHLGDRPALHRPNIYKVLREHLSSAGLDPDRLHLPAATAADLPAV